MGFSDAVLQAGACTPIGRHFICLMSCIDLIVNFFLGVWGIGWGGFGRSCVRVRKRAR